LAFFNIFLGYCQNGDRHTPLDLGSHLAHLTDTECESAFEIEIYRGSQAVALKPPLHGFIAF
jgi:hypothetical protein